jgi:hypothetical protein
VLPALPFDPPAFTPPLPVPFPLPAVSVLAPPVPVLEEPVPVELEPPAPSFIVPLGSPEPHPTITVAMAMMTTAGRKVNEGITTYFGSERDAFGQAQTRSRNEVNYVFCW